jgi:hypothetical protein
VVDTSTVNGTVWPGILNGYYLCFVLPRVINSCAVGLRSWIGPTKCCRQRLNSSVSPRSSSEKVRDRFVQSCLTKPLTMFDSVDAHIPLYV